MAEDCFSPSGITLKAARDASAFTVQLLSRCKFFQDASAFKKNAARFWSWDAKAQRPLEAWYKIVSKAEWSGPADVKATFGTSVDFVGDSRVIFDVGGNKFRIVAHIAYRHRRVLIKFVGTHKEYDQIDARTV